MKRFGSFNVNCNKKQKIQDDLDDLWGEDLDVKDVDDCFMLASQALEQDVILCTQINNVSILPSYHTFKHVSNNAFTSTQSNQKLNVAEPLPTTSKSQVNGCKQSSFLDIPKEDGDVDVKIQKLEEDYEVKVGEVSILRSKLEEIQRVKEDELHKQQKDWSNKLTLANKELTGVKSELEFKNLEIANLKQQVVEQIKRSSLDATINLNKSVLFKQPKISEGSVVKENEKNSLNNHKKNFKIHPTISKKYPLKDKIPNSVFCLPSEEKYIADIEYKHSSRNTVPYLQNQMSQELTEKLIRLQPKVTVMEDNIPLSINMIYADICMLMNCSEHALNLNQNLTSINNVLCISEQFIQNVHSFLIELEQNVHHPNSGNMMVLCLENQAHLNRSPFDSKKWSENELGISARQTIALISVLLPYNNYLQGYLLQNKSLSTNISQEYTKLPAIIPKLKTDYANKFDYLHLILNVIRIIQKLRKSSYFSGFLSAVVMLLNKITLCCNIGLMSDNKLVYNVMKEVILCGPDLYTMLQLTEFLKNASLQKHFVNQLCKMPLKIDKQSQLIFKDKLLYYSEDKCVLQVFCVFLEEMSKRWNSKMVDLHLNMTKFISNSFRHNPPWLFYQEDKYCVCLYKIVTLYINILYQTLKVFNSEKSKYVCVESTKYFEILKIGISILYILNFKVYDLIIKYLTAYSQYKVVITSLLNLKKELQLNDNQVELLDSLHVPEEIPTLEKNIFKKVSLWKKCSLFN